MATLYFRSDKANVNGLFAGKLLATNSAADGAFGDASVPYTWLYSHSIIVVRTSAGSETVIGSAGSAQNQIAVPQNSYVAASATWSCPSTTVGPTDSVVVKNALGSTPGGATFLEPFSTGQNPGSLAAATWTFYRYNSAYYDGDAYWGMFGAYGSATYPSRIEGVTFGGGGIPLVIAGATHAHTAAAPALTQHHALAIGSASHALTSVVVALVQHHTVVVASAAHTITSDEVVATQHSPPLVIASADHALTSGSVGLVQHGALAIAGATHALASGDVELAQHHVLAISGGTHAHAAGSLALTQHSALAIASGTHAHAAGSPALTQHQALQVASAAHALESTTPTLTERRQLAIAGAAHELASDTLALAQYHVLAIAGAASALISAQVSLVQHGALEVAGSAHSLTSSAVELVEHRPQLAIADALHTIASGEVAVWLNPSHDFELRITGRDTGPTLGIGTNGECIRFDVEVG